MSAKENTKTVLENLPWGFPWASTRHSAQLACGWQMADAG